MASIWRDQGITPYSVRFGDSWYSYQGTEPFASVLGIYADLFTVMASDDLTDKKKDDLAIAMTAALSGQITNKTFLSGFNDFISGINDPYRSGDRFKDNMIRSFVPRVVAQVERQVDPAVRDARTSMDMILAQIPWVSESLPKKKNLFGETVFATGSLGPDIVSPVRVSEVKPNIYNEDKEWAQKAFDVRQEFIELVYAPGRYENGRAHPETLPDYPNMPPMGPRTMERYHTLAGKRITDNLHQYIQTKDFKTNKKAALNNKKAVIQVDGIDKEIFLNRSAIEYLHGQFQEIIRNSRKQAQAELINDPEFGPGVIDALKAVQEQQSKIERARLDHLRSNQ